MAWKLFGCLGCKDPRDDNLLSSRPVDLSGEVREQESKREEVSHESCSIPTPESPTCSDLQEGSKSKDENLWVLAKARLSPEDQKQFGSGQELPIETVVEEVRTTVEAKYTEYKKGRLQIRRRKGENINVRDYFQKILKSVLQIQDIIKNVVSFDPTGHASQAWAVVSIGLTLVNNDLDRRDAILEASEFLADILSYYAIIDQHYRNRKVESDERLEEALVKIYTAILAYTAEVDRAHQESGGARIVKSISALAGPALERLKDDIKLESDNVKTRKDLTVHLDQMKQADNILDHIDDLVTALQKVEKRTQSAQDLDILNWLSPTHQSGAEQSAIYNKAQKDRSSQTGDWFLDSPEYQKWKAEPGSILWLHGVVGCGKTVLCSTIIADFDNIYEDDPTKRLAYWYFNFNQEKTQVLDIMLRSIIRQLCPNPVPKYVIKLWKEHCPQGREPTQRLLLGVLEQILESSPGSTFLILDALDECPERPGNQARETLLNLLNELIERHRPILHILATSRPEYDIRFHLGKHQTFDIEEGLSEDVERFVNDRLEQGKLKEWLNQNPLLKEKIREKLLSVEKPRFRWADLQLVRLEGCHTEGAILHTLDTLPETLSDTYSTILNDLPEFDRKAARTILIWVTFSYLPLTLELLARLVNFFVPQSVIYVCTTSLITVSSYDLVRLAHFSVKEFLVSSNSSEQQDWYQFSVSSGNLTIVDMSLSLLLKQDKELTRNEAFDQPELVYAAKYLRFHLPKLDIEYQSPELHEKIDKLFRHSAVYYNWQRIEYDKKISSIWHYSPDDHEPLIYRASKMGLMKTVKRLLDDGASPFTPFYMKFGSDDNAFWVAARRGNLDVLDLLLQVKIDIRQDIAHEILNIIDTRDENMERVRTTLNLLHDRSSFYSGYDPKQGNAIDDDVFAEAASNQRSGDVLVQILLDWPNRAVIHFTPRIMRAVVTNTKLGDKIMQQVLDSQYGSGEMTPSNHYDPMGAEIVVEKAGRGIKLDYSKLRDWVRQTTSEIIHLLLSYRENILITSDLLIAATANSDPGVFRILISQKPPSVHITTEVLAAVAQRNKSEDLELMEMLLENWDPDTPISEEVIYALASNTFRGEEIMRLLLQRQQAGIYVSQRTLAMAAQFHRREMVELLIKNAGPDTRITEEVLCGAACNSREPEAMMKYLFELGGSEVDISDELLISAAGNCQIDDLLSLTLDWFPQERVADRVFKAACDSTNAMTVLLKRFPRQFPTEIVVEAIAHGPFPSAYQDVLELLIAQEKIHIDQNLVERLSWNWRALGTFSRLQPDFPVSPLALATAAKDIKSMEALLYDRHLVFDITADIVDAALQTVGFAVIRLLFGRHRSDFPITHMVLTRAALHPDSQEVLEFLLKVEHKVVIQEVWEYVWGSDSAETDKIEASIVLGKHATLRLTESLMETMSSRSVHDEFDFDDLIAFCAENNISMAKSERALSIVIERSYYPWTVELFLRYNPEIKVTQEQFNALTGDGDAAESLMQILLGRKNMC